MSTHCVVECTVPSGVSGLQPNAILSLSASDCSDLSGLIGSCNCSVSVREQISCIRSICSSDQLENFELGQTVCEGQTAGTVSDFPSTSPVLQTNTHSSTSSIAFPTVTGTSTSAATRTVVSPSSASTSASSRLATAIPSAAISSTNPPRHISSTLAAALATLFTLLFVAAVLLFLRWRKRYITSRAHTSPLSLAESRRADRRDERVLDICAARPFVRLADHDDISSGYRSSCKTTASWRASQQHPTVTREYSVQACAGSAYSSNDVLPPVPTKPIQARTEKARQSHTSFAQSSRQSRLDAVLARAPQSLSLPDLPPPPPKIERQSSATLVPPPPSPDKSITAESARQTGSHASADERFVVLPWPLGERLLELLATSRAPGARLNGSVSDSSEGLPDYMSQE